MARMLDALSELADTNKEFPNLVELGIPEIQEKIDAFRADFEAVHGESDYSRQYTSQLPTHLQSWLLHNQTQAYFDGLPPFLQAAYEHLIAICVGSRRYSEIPKVFLKLYWSNGGSLRRRGYKFDWHR